MMYSCYEGRYVDGEIIYSEQENGEYYMEVIRPTLFEKGSVRIFKHAHPDSLSRDHLIKTGTYEELETMRWEFRMLTDPIQTAYGDM